MKRVAVLSIVVVLSSCTLEQVALWQAWFDQDPDAALEFANSPQIQAELAAGIDEGGPSNDSYLRGYRPGDCGSYHELFAAYDLPVQTFSRIAWRESGCNHRSYVSDGNDEGGGLLGLNLKGSNAGYWRRLCGLTTGTVTDAETNVRCAADAYRQLGLSPWQ